MWDNDNIGDRVQVCDAKLLFVRDQDKWRLLISADVMHCRCGDK